MRNLIFGLLIAITANANAALTVFSSIGGSPSGVVYENFDTAPLGVVTNFALPSGIVLTTTPNAEIAQVPNVPGIYAAPFVSAGQGVPFGDLSMIDHQDTTHYVSAGTSVASILFPGEMHYVGMLWGSVDQYNTLSFYNAGTLIGSIVGNDVLVGANGSQTLGGTVYANIGSTLAFDEIRLTSSQFAFEMDNLSFNPAIPSQLGGPVPEPSAIVLWGLGTLGLVGARKRFI
jgi:PEP-CTERM motif